MTFFFYFFYFFFEKHLVLLVGTYYSLTVAMIWTLLSRRASTLRDLLFFSLSSITVLGLQPSTRRFGEENEGVSLIHVIPVYDGYAYQLCGYKSIVDSRQDIS